MYVRPQICMYCIYLCMYVCMCVVGFRGGGDGHHSDSHMRSGVVLESGILPAAERGQLKGVTFV